MVSSEFDARGITKAEKEFRRAYQTQARAAGEMARAEERSAQQRRQAINTTANAMGALGLAMVAMAGLAVAKAAEFDKAMSNVGATGVESLGALRDAAMQAGRDTAYGATEAAGAIEQMAKAGVAAGDILAGGLTATLDLAAAGELDVARAAEITAITLKQFALTGRDATKVADLLAAGANKAVGGVEDLAQGLEYVGPVAAQLGVSLEETTGTLSMFAEQGILGQKAGTGLRGVLMSMTAPSAAATAAMEKYNISVFDAQNKFIGLEGVAGQLKDRLGGLDEKTRSAALGQIFGNEQITAARILYQGGAEDVAEWTAAVDESGYAAQVAADRLDNLQGDIQILRGSFETLLISLGDGGQGALRDMTQSATGMVNALAELPPAAQGALLSIVGGGGLALLGAAGIMRLTTAIAEAKLALVTLGISAKTAGLLVGGIGAAMGIAAVGLGLWAAQAQEARERTGELKDTLDEFGKATDATMSTINEALTKNRSSWLDSMFGKDAGSMTEQAEKFGLAVEDLQGYIMGNADAVDKVTAARENYVRAAGSSAFFGTLDSEASALTNAEKAALLKAEADDAAGVAAEDLAKETRDVVGALEEQVSVLSEVIDLQREAAGVVLSERDAQRELQDSIRAATEALSENGATLDITTKAGAANQEALDAIAKSGWDVVEAMDANGSSQGSIQTAMGASRDAFILAATAMGMGADEANRLADEMKLIPEQVGIDVTVDTKTAELVLNQWITTASGKRIRLGVDTYGGATYQYAPNAQVANARGNIVEFYGSGGLRPMDSVAQVVAPNTWRVVGDRGDVPEAYIPINNSARSHAILAETAARMGYGVGGSPGSSIGGGGPIDLSSRSVSEIGRVLAGVQIGLDGRVVSQSVDERLGERLR